MKQHYSPRKTAKAIPYQATKLSSTLHLRKEGKTETINRICGFFLLATVQSKKKNTASLVCHDFYNHDKIHTCSYCNESDSTSDLSNLLFLLPMQHKHDAFTAHSII